MSKESCPQQLLPQLQTQFWWGLKVSEGNSGLPSLSLQRAVVLPLRHTMASPLAMPWSGRVQPSRTITHPLMHALHTKQHRCVCASSGNQHSRGSQQTRLVYHPALGSRQGRALKQSPQLTPTDVWYCPSIQISPNLFSSSNTPVTVFPLGKTQYSLWEKHFCIWKAQRHLLKFLATKRGLFLRSTVQNPGILILIPSDFSHPKPECLAVSCIAVVHHVPHQKDAVANGDSHRAQQWKSREKFLCFSCKISNSGPFLETVFLSAITTSASGAFTMNTDTDISFKRSFAVSRWIV